MSAVGGVMALVTALLRVLLMRYVPKRTFVALWLIVAVRLLVPFEPVLTLRVPVPAREAPAAYAESVPAAAARTPAAVREDTGAAVTATAPEKRVSVPLVVWCVGVDVCAFGFAALYVVGLRRFRFAVPVENDVAIAWLRAHTLRRRLALKELGGIASPLTYGIARPVILTPLTMDWHDADTVRYALEHEFVHVRRFDAAKKLILTLALAVHWFNPAVWLMYALASRDIELSCDEAVIRRFGTDARAGYARALIAMEERRTLSALTFGFGKKPTEERIIEIMKTKNRSAWSLALAALLVAALTACAVASAETIQDVPKAAESNALPAAEKSDIADTDRDTDETRHAAELEALREKIEEVEAGLHTEDTAEMRITLNGQPLPEQSYNAALGRHELTLAVGGTVQLGVLATPENVDVEWITGDDTVIELTPDGGVTALREGTAVLYVTAPGAADELFVHVVPSVVRYTDTEGESYTVTLIFDGCLNQNGEPMPLVLFPGDKEPERAEQAGLVPPQAVADEMASADNDVGWVHLVPGGHGFATKTAEDGTKMLSFDGGETWYERVKEGGDVGVIVDGRWHDIREYAESLDSSYADYLIKTATREVRVPYELVEIIRNP